MGVRESGSAGVGEEKGVCLGSVLRECLESG